VHDNLPSVRFNDGDPRPIGFVSEVDADHLQAIGIALREVCDVLNAGAQGDQATIRARYCSIRYIPTLPFVLFAFNIPNLNDQLEFVDDIAAGDEINYAIVANQPIEVQREAAILFAYELVFRHQVVESVRTDRTEIRNIDSAAAESDGRARQEFTDRIRFGWRAAAEWIAQFARSEGIPLAARYEVDVFPDRRDIARRVPVLREAYNTIPIAREAIDKVVSMIGGQDPRITVEGLSQADEDMLQRQVASLGMRQWVSQTQRDADVCGNGYLVTGGETGLDIYALRPEEVIIVDDEAYCIERDGTVEPVEGDVLHVRGLDQFESPYGISVLEPILYEHRTRKVFEDSRAFAQEALRRPDLPDEHRQWAEHTIALAERTLAASDERLAQLLFYPRDWVPDARDGLYFPGQETM
jgi:hypothetical protein